MSYEGFTASLLAEAEKLRRKGARFFLREDELIMMVMVEGRARDLVSALTDGANDLCERFGLAKDLADKITNAVLNGDLSDTDLRRALERLINQNQHSLGAGRS